MKKNWFESWFDTPYYHILYKNRNDEEAHQFMEKIIDFLEIPKSSHIADLPCGKGRHARFLNSLGYKVTAGDLSKNSIDYAKQFENDTLSFEVWDMRIPLEQKYDAVFNLFTSFGYFDDDEQDLQVLKSIKNGLKKDGLIVIDFLNVAKAIQNLKARETKIIQNISFDITKEFKDNFIHKHIAFNADDQAFVFTEKVKHISLETFARYFKAIDMEIIHIFGDYSLKAFNKNTSDRLILVAK